ncbi:Uncharacterised protein [Yersinia frederiksenii]|nr:Uncharacterised protein [Yersinia frederiksenii]
MNKLTAAEKKWVKQVNALLAKCPSKRLGFYTIGDNDVMLYDAEQFEYKGLMDDHRDLIHTLEDHELKFDDAFNLKFPNDVEGVCG